MACWRMLRESIGTGKSCEKHRAAHGNLREHRYPEQSGHRKGENGSPLSREFPASIFLRQHRNEIPGPRQKPPRRFGPIRSREYPAGSVGRRPLPQRPVQPRHRFAIAIHGKAFRRRRQQKRTVSRVTDVSSHPAKQCQRVNGSQWVIPLRELAGPGPARSRRPLNPPRAQARC